jgi:UPF0716 protein FxsA
VIWVLLALLVLVPAVEIFVLLQIGALIGPAPTFLLLLLTGVIGAWLAKREGLAVLGTLQQDLQRGLPPGERVMEGALVVVGGLLLVTPGVVTDVVGVLLLFPPARRWLAPRALRWLMGRIQVGALPEDVPDLDGPGSPASPGADDGVRRRGPEPAFRRPERRPSPFGSPFDDLP